MREVVVTPPVDHGGTHIIRHQADDGEVVEEVITGDQAALERWNALHGQYGADTHAFVSLSWHERVRYVDADGNVVGEGVEQRARFSLGSPPAPADADTGA